MKCQCCGGALRQKHPRWFPFWAWGVSYRLCLRCVKKTRQEIERTIWR